MKNVQIDLFYRDASNYKNSGRHVFSGPLLPRDVVRLQKCLVDELGFVPTAVGVPDLAFDSGIRSEDDHPWHDIQGVRTTDDPADDDRTFSRFVDDCENASWTDAARTWEEETPLKEYVPDEDDFDDDLDQAA